MRIIISAFAVTAPSTSFIIDMEIKDKTVGLTGDRPVIFHDANCIVMGPCTGSVAGRTCHVEDSFLPSVWLRLIVRGYSSIKIKIFFYRPTTNPSRKCEPFIPIKSKSRKRQVILHSIKSNPPLRKELGGPTGVHNNGVRPNIIVIIYKGPMMF